MTAPYLVRLVVVLGIVLEDVLLLGVLPRRQCLVELDFFPPLLALDKPGAYQYPGSLYHHLSIDLHVLGEFHIELASAQKPQLSRCQQTSCGHLVFFECVRHTSVSVSRRSV